MPQVKGSDVCFLAEMQKSVGGIIQLVRGLQLEEGPTACEVSIFTPLYKLAVKRMENFFTFDGVVENTDPCKTVFPRVVKALTGRPALVAKYAQTVADIEQGAEFDLTQLQWAKTYNRAFGTKERAQADSWLFAAKGLNKRCDMAVLDGNPTDSGAAAGAASSGSDPIASKLAANAALERPKKKPKSAAEAKQQVKTEETKADMMCFSPAPRSADARMGYKRYVWILVT